MTDMNSREIKLYDVFCRPSDCDDLQFIGVVTGFGLSVVIGSAMTVGSHVEYYAVKNYYEPADIKVLASIEDTRLVVPESVTA